MKKYRYKLNMLEPGLRMIKAIGILTVIGFILYLCNVALLCYLFVGLAALIAILLWILLVIESHQDKVLNEQAILEKMGKTEMEENEMLEKSKVIIDKERTWIFSPVNNIVIKVDISGNVKEEQLKEAIKVTVSHYEMFHQRIALDNEGNAYYERSDYFEPVIKPMKKDWKEVAKEQEKNAFVIDKGEFVRFFYSRTEIGATLLIIAHHIAGDGISFTYLIQDIVRSLSGDNIDDKKLELFNMESLPKEAKLPAPTTWLMKYMNRKWKNTGRTFDFNEYYCMYNKFWYDRDTNIYTFYLENDKYNSLCKYSKENNVTVNTLITTAFLRASEELSDVGIAASIREKGYTGMGNYATGISIKHQYNEKSSFLDNARSVQKKIDSKLNDPTKKYFLLQFMRNIEPTLIDAIYFGSCSDYKNSTAATFSRMFGYDGNPKGISITNLTRLPIETKYGDYEIRDFIFVPPLVLNAKRIIGIASIGNKMVLTLHLNNDTDAEKHRIFFNKAMQYLMNY